MKSMKKWIVAAAAVSAAALALSGCGTKAGGATGEVKASDGDVTIRIGYWGSDSRVKLTEEVIKGFEEKHPNIKVDMTYNDWSGYWDKLATDTAGKNSPDVMQMDELYLASYASQGSLVDLDTTSKYLDLSGMDESLRDMGKVDGTQYAAPVSSTAFGVVLNNDVIKSLGLTVPDTSNWTWDDLKAFAKQVVDKSNGETVGIAPLNNGMSLQLWARQHNENLFKDGKVAISEDTLASYLQMAYDWTHGDQISGTPDHQAEQASGTTDQSDFATGKQAMIFTQSTQVSVYAKAAGTDNMTLVPIPNDGENAKYGYLKPGMYWAISSQSKHPAEAAELIDYLLNDEDAGKTMSTDRGIPSNNKIREALADSATGTDKQALDFPSQIQDTLGEAPSITPNGASDLDKIIARYSQKVMFGDQSSADAAKAMISELNTAIASA
ncbi:ABC transporter substrate-binding protein [Bifidobacterium biavatii]|uniref:ABC transporter, extracellular substrate binding protein n=1 Tax=Bifidobacterium biavatii DSM 23969 TaxID=1437608 RepID=A0A086ZWP2_9BIFI|nr:extracellular solute-binding protein [Bifidobacterium biavatii]KFI50942.1 ABC transporter, extracellular substrate binding protein [Bifidobacterium biavatii DSM 23969]